MATQAAAALLDELMGRSRNVLPEERNQNVHWDSPEVRQGEVSWSTRRRKNVNFEIKRSVFGRARSSLSLAVFGSVPSFFSIPFGRWASEAGFSSGDSWPCAGRGCQHRQPSDVRRETSAFVPPQSRRGRPAGLLARTGASSARPCCRNYAIIWLAVFMYYWTINFS